MEEVEYENTMCKETLDHAQGKVDTILELFIDNMTTDFSDQFKIGEQSENGLKVGKIQSATASSLLIYPQEEYLLSNQKPTQGNQK